MLWSSKVRLKEHLFIDLEKNKSDSKIWNNKAMISTPQTKISTEL